MSSDVALSVRGLSKCYRIRPADDHPEVTLAEAALARVRRKRASRQRDEFWALSEVEFDVRRGEVLGIIGHNGAGKSTLLKILSRITPPTRGHVELHGRIGSLLEVGTGFHPELTGRENIFLNGTILGMRRKEVERRFDEIVDFAGVERFLDTPVKRYSSGMYVRLAFAVAAHLDTEILLIDEVLAVGDAAFQRKSLGKMGEAASGGKTVLLVSHDIGIMTQLANRCVLLEGGRAIAEGSPEDVIERYSAAFAPSNTSPDFTEARRPRELDLDRAVVLLGGEVRNVGGLVPADESLHLRVRLRIDRSLRSLRFTFTVHRIDGQPVGTTFLTVAANSSREQEVVATLSDLRLAPGHYFLGLAVADGATPIGARNHDVVADVLHFEMAPTTSGGIPDIWHAGWGSTRLGVAHQIDDL